MRLDRTGEVKLLTLALSEHLCIETHATSPIVKRAAVTFSTLT